VKNIARVLLVLSLLACAIPVPNAAADGVPKCTASSC
jgi:hypothetical protein